MKEGLLERHRLDGFRHEVFHDLRRAGDPAERNGCGAKAGAVSLGLRLVQREDQRFAAHRADHFGLRRDSLEHAAARA